MKTLSRKQREIQQREGLILDAAREMLLREGFGKLSMDKVARAVEYSKGTIYQHFGSKEDLLVALALDTIHMRNRMFERAAVFAGRPRERMTAIGVAYELFFRLNPSHFNCCLLVHSDAVLHKTLAERASSLQACEMRTMDICVGIVRDAIASGDLSLPSQGSSAQELSFGLWALHFGAYRLMATDVPLEDLGVRDGFETVRRMSQSILDGLDWQPLSKDWDYMQTAQRVLAEVFPEEAASLGG